jgi:hypothetical protein
VVLTQSHVALDHVARALEEAGVGFALSGGFALGEHGYVRVTVDPDLLVTAEGLERFKSCWLGRGFVESRPGSRSVREAETGVAIDFLAMAERTRCDSRRVHRAGNRPRVRDLRTLIELKHPTGCATSRTSSSWYAPTASGVPPRPRPATCDPRRPRA